MKQKLLFLLLTLILTSCNFNDYVSKRIKSPTGNYEIQVTVSRSDKNAKKYADVIIHIFDQYNKKMTEINTGAGDENKWAIGWTKSGDTIVLQSSDIGNKAWVFQNGSLTEIKMTDKLNERAEILKSEKYE